MFEKSRGKLTTMRRGIPITIPFNQKYGMTFSNLTPGGIPITIPLDQKMIVTLMSIWIDI